MFKLGFDIVSQAAQRAGAAATALSAPLRVLLVGDSQFAGRGTGTGAVAMDGARALSVGPKLAAALADLGWAASAQYGAEANNTGGTLPGYDPRWTLGTWAVGTTGSVIGGKAITKTNAAGAGPLTFTPAIPVDTFDVYCQRNNFGTIHLSIDGGAVTQFSETGTAGLVKVTITAALGIHTLSIERDTGNSLSVFIAGIHAYNSVAKEFRVMNASARAWDTTTSTTIGWTAADTGWRGLNGIGTLAPDISVISLGVNDLRSGGAGLTSAQTKTNLQTIINKCLLVPGSKVILALPMPIDPASEGSYTMATLKTVYEELSVANSCPLLDTYALLGDWTTANGAGETSDNLHWKAAASVSVADALAPLVVAAAA